jgi:hypothetical protein
MKHSKWFPILVFVLLVSLLTPITARADMAPPKGPPGTNIVPGSENTQVRMVAETVTLTVIPTTEAAPPAPAKTPSPGLPVCGGTALLLPALAGLLGLFSKRR